MRGRLLLLPVLVFASASILAQSETATPAVAPRAPTFTIADVHPSPWIVYRNMSGGTLHGDRYTLRQATLLDLISNAWSLDRKTIQGGPSWLTFDRFEIVAQAPRGTSPATLKLMLRSLLIQRFGLVTHNGIAPMPVWMLTAVKPKLVEVPSGTPECAPTTPSASSTPMYAAACHSMPMDEFAPILQLFPGNYLDNQPVEDATGLKGKYDFEFQWSPRAELARAGSDGVSIFDALAKLGLRLDLKTDLRPGLIVDKVSETPTPNAPGIEKALPPEPPVQFEVAVIKPARPGEETVTAIGGEGLWVLANTVKELIQLAWNLNIDDDEAVAGLPSWAASDRYDMKAKAPTDELVRSVTGHREVEDEQARQMLQALLIERFGMEAHIEERPVTAYNLELAGLKVDPKLKVADPAERTECGQGPSPGQKETRSVAPALDREFHCQNITLSEFGGELSDYASDYVRSPVLDDTGLKGRYDITLSFSDPDSAEPGAGDSPSAGSAPNAPSDPSGAMSLYDAVRRQLGLRLEKVRRPGAVLVIDHINRQPSDN
ncbi:MAG TPA: TIGR03435 family protein [Acidobacteriaceae bacterium]|jgi:uncharacterized protein (TIGR03435 family)